MALFEARGVISEFCTLNILNKGNLSHAQLECYGSIEVSIAYSDWLQLSRDSSDEEV